MSYAVLRTHGGLGNQLFQILYGRLFADAQHCELREVHDHRYRHQFRRAPVPAISMPPSVWQSAISATRFPKILQRALGCAEAPWRFLGVWFLDGYFQHEAQFRSFSDESISRQLELLALELGIESAHEEAHLVHLRLGDFFGDRGAAKRHVIDRFGSIPFGAHIMTNDEALLADPEISELMNARQAHLVSTRDFSAEDVLRTLARYRQIDANDSTLTFWAHVLAGTNVKFRDTRLFSLACYFNALSPKRSDRQFVSSSS